MVLQKYCIPVPVVGGLLCTVIILIGHETGAFEIKFDMAFKDFFMLLFYSGIGFTASWKLLKKGGPQVIIFLIISSVVVVFQNLLGVGLSKLMGIDPLIGLATGSIPHDRRPRNVGSIRSRFRGGRTCKCQHNFAGRRYIRPGCRQPDRRADPDVS